MSSKHCLLKGFLGNPEWFFILLESLFSRADTRRRDFLKMLVNKRPTKPKPDIFDSAYTMRSLYWYWLGLNSEKSLKKKAQAVVFFLQFASFTDGVSWTCSSHWRHSKTRTGKTVHDMLQRSKTIHPHYSLYLYHFLNSLLTLRIIRWILILFMVWYVFPHHFTFFSLTTVHLSAVSLYKLICITDLHWFVDFAHMNIPA